MTIAAPHDGAILFLCGPALRLCDAFHDRFRPVPETSVFLFRLLLCVSAQFVQCFIMRGKICKALGVQMTFAYHAPHYADDVTFGQSLAVGSVFCQRGKDITYCKHT